MADEEEQNKPCATPWGQTVPDGGSTVAFKDPQTKYGETAVSEIRVCHNGDMSGSFGNRESLGLPQEASDDEDK